MLLLLLCVAILLLLLLLLVIVHLSPEVVLHVNNSSSTCSQSFVIPNENTPLIGHPWECVRFCAASTFTYTTPLMAITGIRRAAGKRQPAAAKPPLNIP